MIVRASDGPIRRPRTRQLAIALLSVGALAAACGPGSGPPRPTDPRQILVQAITATAALPTLRLHAEVSANFGGAGGMANVPMRMALDADVDLATRQLAGRATTQVPQNLGGVGGAGGQQVSDTIVTTTATFSRNGQSGRWSKIPSGMGGGISGGPTNAQIATMLTNLLSNPAIGLELREASACSLGTCDHVLAHIDGQTLGAAIGPLLGMPLDATGASIPSFDIDVLVDQSTSVISELRTQIAIAGTTEQIFLSVSNPGQPVQIVPPPPALTDDFGANFGGGSSGGFGPAPSPILEQVGSELPTTMPSAAERLPSP